MFLLVLIILVLHFLFQTLSFILTIIFIDTTISGGSNITWTQNLGVRTYQKHYERYDNTQQMNIMQDGFSYVFTFGRFYDISYYSIYFYWYYYDSTTNEFYAFYMPPVNCTLDQYSEDVLVRLYNYTFGSGII